jgi:predicted ATPase/DNA-binding NarL/FixJ family response regulator
VQRLLATTRLLTLLGPGGIGKTRIALEVGRALSGDLAEKVVLVDLAPLADGALVAQAVASAVGVIEQSDRPLLSSLVDALASRQLLLILDNCEHVVDGCARVADALLAGCPRLRILATSREPLGITGEVLFPVPALALREAAQLFVQRAQAVQPALEVDEQAVASICQRLDGLPLAIELAAARTRLLTLDEIGARLADRFGLLTTGSRTAPARHQTLRATLEWSYDLLSAPEQRLLERLSVFVGGWTLAAAEAVCSGEGLEPRDLLDLLGRLVDRSLVVAAAGRYRLLESVRQFGAEHLDRRGEQERLAQQHAAYFLELGERADADLLGPCEDDALSVLEAELDNLRAALRWLVACGLAAEAQRLGAVLGLVWFFRSALSEGRAWLDRLLAMPTLEGATPQRARCLFADANIAAAQADYPAARHLAEEALRLWRQLGDAWHLGAALYLVGHLSRILGDVAAAQALLDDAAASSHAAGNTYYEALSRIALADLHTGRADLATALRSAEEGRVLASQTGRPRLAVHALRSMADVQLERGELRAAAVLVEAAVRLAREQRLSSWWLVQGLLTRARVATLERDVARATALVIEALSLSREIGNRAAIAPALDLAAQLAVIGGEPRRALVLSTAAARIRQTLGGALLPASARLRRQLDAALSALSPDVRRAAAREGERLEIDESIDYALAGLQPTPAAQNQPLDALTPREREVARLVAQGLSNRQVAERLVLTEKTAANHLGRVFEKLGVQSRGQLAARARELGLILGTGTG